MEYVELSYGIGYVISDLPKDIKKLINKHAIKAREAKISHAHGLVGQIQEEWAIPFDPDLVSFVDYLSELATVYEQNTGKEEAPEGTRKVFPHIKFWLNHQKKTQFQPAHTHDGKYSFVIWLKIPYKIEDEFSLPFVKEAKEKTPGCFCFLTPTPFSHHIHQTRILADNTHEGKVILFPADLTHMVYPFYTSDKDRISIAGNLSDPIFLRT